MGLGEGLVLGYLAGSFRRPTVYYRSYNYPGDFYTSVPLLCSKADSVNYFDARVKDQIFDIDETEDFQCGTSDDVCWARMEIQQVNISSSSMSTKKGLVVKITKGCAVLSELKKKYPTTKYNYKSDRKCFVWKSPSKDNEVDAKLFNENKGFLELIGVPDVYKKYNVSAMKDIEMCYCDVGDNCNLGHRSVIAGNILIITLIILSLFK